MSTIAIVGAGHLLGMGIARKFGKQGFKVALISRSAQSLDKYVGQLKAQGIEAAGFAADASKKADLISAFKKI